MDQIFNPNFRKWVSDPLQMGRCMEDVKNLVLIHKDDLVIIDPTPAIKAYMGMSHSQDERGGGSDHPPDFMRPTALKIEEDSLLNETETETEAEKQKQDKWSESDAACEAAVGKVGGTDFFLFKKKKPKKKGKRSKVKRSGEYLEGDEEDDDEDDEDMDLDDDDPVETTTFRSRSESDIKSMDTRMYENYNYEQTTADFDSNVSFDDELKSLMEITDANERREISLMIPEALQESDDEEGDWLECDDDTDNFAGDAQRYEDLKQMIENGSDNSDEDEQAQYSTDDEQVDAVEQQSRTSPADGQTPGPSRTMVKMDNDTPLRSALKKGRNPVKKDNKRVTICAGEENSTTSGPSSMMSITGIKKEPSEEQETNTPASDVQDESTAADVQDSTADFKRFTDWVFSQNSKRDKEFRKAFRPELMKRLSLNEDQVRMCQTVTSANLTSVKGEVFQDEPVMQSSSMPLLAPPTSVPARTTLQSLAIFLTHGEDPSVFPWKSINVQQQMNDDFVNHQFMKRMDQQKLDTINPLMKDLLVNKEDDFLVQVLIYQATDPEDVLPDEVKLRGRMGNEVEVIAAMIKPGRRRIVADYSDGSGLGYGTAVTGPSRYIEPKLAYEVNLLGSQTIKDLMRMFHCENDYVCLKDTPHPDSHKEDPTQYAKSKFPWSMVLIDDTIYADPASEIDYVNIINKWAKKPPEKCIGPFKRGDWNRKLKDVTLRYGYPYVFVHLGGCEHIFVFTKSRLLHVEDEHLLTSYPNIVGMTRFKNVYCRVDNEYLARWAVLDFKEFPENPMLLCTECVQMYCYDKSKKKRGDFKLYPFTQMANIL